MHEYILNISKIVQNYPDNSDYENFYTFCVHYVENNVNTHEDIKIELLNAIKIYINETLISIAYRLLNKLRVNYNVEAKYVRKHLESEYLTNDVFFYIAKNDVTEFDEVVTEKLFDKDYTSKGLFELLKLERFKHVLIDFLNMENEAYITKQIDIMVATGFIVNTEYYVSYIGSEYKNICFKAYELLYHISKTNFEDDFLYVRDNVIEFKKTIDVNSVSNFFFFFFDFFESKHDILHNYQISNHSVKALLEKYLKNADNIQLTDRQVKILLDSLDYKKTKIENEKSIKYKNDTNFDYLFTNIHFKACIDCLEI